MTISEKLRSSTDKAVFTLFKEGLFYKCYNEDAMVFVQKVKEYKVNLKFIKSVGDDVLSLGFPVSEVEKENLKLQLISEAIDAVEYNEKPYGVVFILKKDIKQNFTDFYKEVKSSKSIVAEKHLDYKKSTNDILVKMIQEFDLANSTPMQGLLFIQDLKKHV